MTAPNHREHILKKAYEIWETEGRPTGRDMEHWLRAELLLAEETGQAKAKSKPAVKPRKATAKAKAKPAVKPRKTAAKAKATTRKTPAKPKS